MRSRLLPLLAVALLAGLGAGCSAAADSNLEGARLALRSNDYARATANVDAALAVDPDNLDALLLKSEIYRGQYDAAAGVPAKKAYLDANFDGMVATARRAQAVAPGDPRADNAVLNVWVNAVNTGNDIYNDPDGDLAAAIPYLTVAGELVPDSTQSFLVLGLTQLRTGDAADAATTFERATSIDPDDGSLAYYYGQSLLLADRGTEAIAVLEAARERFPDNEDIDTVLLNAYSKAGQPDQVLTSYAERARTQPTDGTVRYNYGSLLLQAGRVDEAITELTEATRLSPDNADAFYNLGASYQNRAAQTNDRANAADNDASTAIYAERDRDLEAAVAPLERARELAEAGSDDEESFCLALFQVYTQLNRIDDATEVAKCARMSMN